MYFLEQTTTDCGGISVPNSLINIVSTIVTLIKIGVPIILIVLGMLDMGKAVASQKEDEIKKGQKILISRCIAAGITFFVVAIVQLLFSIVNGGTEGDSTWSCIDKFVNGTGGSGGGTGTGRPGGNKTFEPY